MRIDSYRKSDLLQCEKEATCKKNKQTRNPSMLVLRKGKEMWGVGVGQDNGQRTS